MDAGKRLVISHPTLLESLFERLFNDPGDTIVLKRLAVEFGAAVSGDNPERLRAFRVLVAASLRAFEFSKLPTGQCMFVRGALCALLDAAAVAEETITDRLANAPVIVEEPS